MGWQTKHNWKQNLLGSGHYFTDVESQNEKQCGQRTWCFGFTRKDFWMDFCPFKQGCFFWRRISLCTFEHKDNSHRLQRKPHLLPTRVWAEDKKSWGFCKGSRNQNHIRNLPNNSKSTEHTFFSVCPPGTFWLFLPYTPCYWICLTLTGLFCFAKHIWNKAKQNAHMWKRVSLSGYCTTRIYLKEETENLCSLYKLTQICWCAVWNAQFGMLASLVFISWLFKILKWCMVKRVFFFFFC